MLFRRNEQRNYSFTLDDEKAAQILGITLNGISPDKAKEATFWTSMRILTDTLSKLPLKLYQENENGTSKATDHYLYSLLKLRPNEYMSASSFWKAIEWNRLYYGHSLAYIDTSRAGRNAGKAKGLYPIDMAKVTIWVDDAGIIGKNNALWYVYQSPSGEIKLKHDQVLHFLGMTRDGITGMAIKDYLRTLVENGQSGQSYVNEYFKNGLFAKGILTYTSQINPEDEKRLKERFQRMASGIKNAGSILPVPIGFDFKSINTSMADAQFLELSQLTMQQIAAAFGIKMHQINSLDRATHSNVEAMQKEFYIDTLQSILTMYEQELSYKLLTSSERQKNFFFEFNVDSILRSSFETRIEALGKAVDKGIYTINEARQVENKPKIDHKYADSLIFNGNAIPIDMLGQQYVKGGEINEE